MTRLTTLQAWVFLKAPTPRGTHLDTAHMKSVLSLAFSCDNQQRESLSFMSLVALNRRLADRCFGSRETFQEGDNREQRGPVCAGP